jgi:hypothetical protein
LTSGGLHAIIALIDLVDERGLVMSDEKDTNQPDGYEDKRQSLEGQKPECPVQLAPMEEWIGEDASFCRPCILPVNISWYKDELKARGLTDLAGKIEQAQDTQDPAQVCKVMDEVKGQVPNDLRYRLLEFDCATQEFAAEEEKTLAQGEASQVPSEPHDHTPDSASESPPETSQPEPPETEP